MPTVRERNNYAEDVKTKFRNAGEAFVSKLGEIASVGQPVTVRGHLTRELRNQTITLLEPLERCITIPGRRNNTFAAIAETMWVIAGRNDLAYLSAYLPRAGDFSDDGTTWRAAYGPRLRHWQGVDQLERVKILLNDSPESRRAVMSLFDPATDYGDSRDVPCTNWLHFNVRDKKLNLNVVVRSNDLMWGFSGINTFEWSVLQEMMAYWVGVEVGESTYFVSSLHLYQRHYDRAARIISQNYHNSILLPATPSPRFNTPFEELSTRLSAWFSIEAQIRSDTVSIESIYAFPDPLLRDFLVMLNAYWTFKRGHQEQATALLDNVHDQALARAGRDYFDWTNSPITEAEKSTDIELPPPGFAVLLGFLIKLHRVKDAMYGDSWKRRGEQMAIMANLARKVDRLVLYRHSACEGTESVLDTAVDFLIYSVKYDTYLRDALGLRPLVSETWSEGTAGFEQALKTVQPSRDDISSMDHITTITKAFIDLEEAVAAGSPPADKAPRVNALSDQAASLVMALCRENPASAYHMMSALDYPNDGT